MKPIDLIKQISPQADSDLEALHGFRFNLAPIQHRRFNKGLYKIAEAHHARQINGKGGGVLITGPAGAGKTVLVSSYASLFQRESTLRQTRIPVLFVTVPSSPTAKSLGEAILIALEYAKPFRGTAPEKAFTIQELFERCGVELLILDEFHHLFYAPTIKHFRDVIDWLKNLINQTNTAVVACGLPEARSVIYANEQLARRFSSKWQISPFNSNDQEEFNEFRGILKLLQEHLPIQVETPIYEANMARRMLIASHGLMDYVCKTLEGAINVAIDLGLKEISLDLLAAGFRNRVWNEVPDKLNPFHPESYLRPLDRSGEVFYLHTSYDSLGSAVAKRISLNEVKGSK